MKFDSLFGSLLDSKRDSSPPRNRIIFWISILLAALFLYLAFRNLEWKAFFATLRNVQIVYLPLLVLWSSLSYATRAYRWKILLSSEKPVAASSVFLANMAGYLGNTVLPARTGELIRAAYIAKKGDIPVSFALATGLTERLMDVIALVVLGSLSLFWAGLLPSTLKAGLKVMGVIGIVGLLAILLLPRFANKIVDLVKRLPLLGEYPKERIARIVQSFLTGLLSLSNAKRAILFTGLTCMVWLTDAAGTVFLSQILSISLTLPQAFVLLAALGLSSAIPSTPGYVGVYQFAAVLALQPFGVSSANAVALILFSQVMGLIVVGVWGAVAVGRFSKITAEPSHE